MTKAEWSGWVQAIGSILAILFSIWIARSPERAARKIALMRVKVLSGGAAASIDNLSKAIAINDLHSLRMFMVTAQLQLEEGADVRSDVLGADVLTGLFMVRTVLSMAFEAVGYFESTGSVRKEEALSKLNVLRGQLDEQVRKMDAVTN